MANAKTKPRRNGKGTALQPVPAELLTFSDNGQEFDRHLNLGKIQALGGLDAMTKVEIGRRLMWHKANLKHGQFLEDLKGLPFAPRTAAKYMNVARKVLGLNAPARAHLTALGFRKIHELCEELSEDEIKQLVDQQAIDAVGTLDAVDKMTVRELRTALRKERKPKKRLSDAEERIKELEAESAVLQGRKLAPTVEHAKEQARSFADHIDAACRDMNRIEIPDEDDADVESQIVGVIASNIHAARTRLDHLEVVLLKPYTSEA